MSAGELLDDLSDDSPKEACGVFGVYAPGQPVAHLTFLGLFALQHRGQESAGMAVSDGTAVTVVKDQGLVASVFDDRALAGLFGHLAIGHCRYSTTGSSTWRNAQPAYRGIGDRQFALGHNGNLTNTEALAADAGMLPGTVTSDTDLVAELLAAELGRLPEDRSDERDLELALGAVLPRLEGAFSLVRHGREPRHRRPRPQRLPAAVPRQARTRAGSWPRRARRSTSSAPTSSASSTPARWSSSTPPGPGRCAPSPTSASNPTLCLFEFVYFARPDTRLYGQSVHQARVHMGEQLADQAPVEADMVMGVPESGVPAAEGFARRSGIPFGQGVVKNRYIGRSFIAPSQELRARAVRMKLNPLRENVAGKRLVVVDDSIVRGTTQRQLTKMLREAGATEVHLRLTSPPVKWPCFYGMDTGDRTELLASSLTVDGIRDYLGVDSLAYMDLDRLIEATGAPGAGFCDACFTGEYPVAVPVTLRKGVLEEPTSPCSAHPSRP